MRRFVISVVVIGLLTVAAPASAQGPVEGSVAVVEPAGWDVGPCPGIGWVGTLDISGHGDMDGTYGFQLYHTDFGSLALNEFWDTGYVAMAAGPFEGLEGAMTFQRGYHEFFAGDSSAPITSFVDHRDPTRSSGLELDRASPSRPATDERQNESDRDGRFIDVVVYP